MTPYGTRRSSQALAAASVVEPIPIGITPRTSTTTTSASPSASSPSLLSSSIGKSRRPLSTSLARRRLSQSNSGLRPPSQSVPAATQHLGPGRGRSGSVGGLGLLGMEDGEDGEVKGQVGRKEKGQLFECEKCNKIYRHSTCLVKHRWEHTAHWKEASKLLLSKHQQVQLLEAAAILKAASTGSSLPDEKSYWPAAVSPPSSGLLGSHSLNINVLTSSSPRLHPSSSLSASPHPQHSLLADIGSEPGSDVELDEDDDEELSAESVSTGDDLLASEMFEMDIDEGVPSAAGAVASFSARGLGGGRGGGSSVEGGSDSGYGGSTGGNGGGDGGPVLGFFQGRAGVGRVV